jgi:aspartyl-tRNA(Asn)/glutamyl-tRNA(Gln) amidotransferase subunit C
MQLADIKKLALMARIDMSEEELVETAEGFDSILAYVGQITEISELSDTNQEELLENVMRDDVATNTSGQYTEKILEEMPDTQDGFLKVKQIL